MAFPDEAQVGPTIYNGPPPKYLIVSHLETYGILKTCHHAQTLEAYSEVLRATVWIPLPCKQWSCRFCCEDKIRRLSRRVESAKPNRLLTLTVDPSLWKDPRDAFDGTRRQVSELIKALRLKWGSIEYLRVTELTKGGWPHYHMLVRSGYLPQPVVKAAWQQLTGAQIVDLRRVKNRFQTYIYLVKYLTKMHKIDWTERHVSYSRKFFTDPLPKKTNPLGLSEYTIKETHPATLLYHTFRKSTLVEAAYNVWVLNPDDELLDKISVARFRPKPTQDNDPCQTTTSPPTPSKPSKQTSMPFLKPWTKPPDSAAPSRETPSGD